MSQPKLIDIAGSLYIPTVALTDATGTIASFAPPATGTRSDITSSASDGTILAANTARKGAIFDNESTSVLYLLFAAGTSSTSNYSIRVPAGGNLFLSPGEYTGIIKGIWASANGSLRVTEFS